VGFGNGCGGARPGAEVADIGVFPRLTGALLDGGFAERELLGILGGNFLRVFRAAWGG
jgi:microsomal dipeptidase-like Zn-dependent dipeptidase